MNECTHSGPAGGIVRAVHRVTPADAAGLSLHLRHAAPRGARRGTLVLVHGATLASGLWDIDVPGYSVLDALAGAGFSVWAPDLRGYARSDRLAAPAAAYAGMHEALLDIDAAVAHACRLDHVSRVLLTGGSWGSITSAAYAATHPGRVLGLALMAPLFASVNEPWLADLADPADRTRLNGALGATRRVERAALIRRWDPEIPYVDKHLRRDDAVLDAMMADALGAEPDQGAGGAFTVPNGTLHDLFEVFSGRPLVDPAAILVPTLLVRGEHDATSTEEDARALFARLGTREKQCLTIGDAGHFICAERQAPQFQQALAGFARRLFDGRDEVCR